MRSQTEEICFHWHLIPPRTITSKHIDSCVKCPAPNTKAEQVDVAFMSVVSFAFVQDSSILSFCQACLDNLLKGQVLADLSCWNITAPVEFWMIKHEFECVRRRRFVI